MERSFIAWAALQSAKLPQVQLGIGDDAAVLATGDKPLVVTCDSLCDGTHFLSDQTDMRSIGRKLASVNLSDIAAMGATPTALFLSFCLPKASATSIAQDLFSGVVEVATQWNCAIAGGDTNTWNGPLVVHATAIGTVKSGDPWQRSNAKVGDLVVVSGELGGSILGKHLNFEPRLKLAEQLRQKTTVRAACDISDGIATDLLNLCSASRCGADIDLDKVPISDAAKTLSASDGKPSIEHALGDGEDFELLFTVPPDQREIIEHSDWDVPLTVVGKIISRTGLWARTKSAKLLPLRTSGYQHQSD